MRLRGLLGLALLIAAPAFSADPVLWPEPQRAFLQDGPGLLLTAEQRRELLAADEAGRAAFLQRFLSDPIPETPDNELVEGIERRRRLAFTDLPLSGLAEATGGKVYFVERADELSTVYGEIERELRSRYFLAYNSDHPGDEEAYRPVEVRVRRGKARTMRGYYP